MEGLDQAVCNCSFIKIKFAQEQAMKAKRGSTVIALLFL